MNGRSTLIAISTLFLALPGCRARLGDGGTQMYIQGSVHSTAGAPIANVRFSGPFVDRFSTAGSDGEFSVALEDVWDEAVVRVEAPGYGPTVIVVRRRGGVIRYHRDVRLPALSSASIDPATGGAVTVSSMGRPITVRIRGGALVGTGATMLRVSPYEPDDAPGELRSQDRESGQRLQSAGMVSMSVVDMAGHEVPFAAGQGFEIDAPALARPLAEVPDAETMELLALDERAGDWSPLGPVPEADQPALLDISPGPRYWNFDRNFLTACVRGTVTTPSGNRCGGGNARGSGPDGISMNNSIDADGAFCVEGAQTFASTLTIGSTTGALQMPATPGSCAAPGSCAEVGEIVLAEADCPTGCPAGQIDSAGGCMSPASPRGPDIPGMCAQAGGWMGCSSRLQACVGDGLASCWYDVDGVRFTCSTCPVMGGDPCAQEATDYQYSLCFPEEI